MFCQICSLLFFCGCSVPSAYRKPVYPDKDLKEIVIYGIYYPEDKERIKKYEEGLQERRVESFEEDYSDLGKEKFIYSSHLYCYNETQNKDPGVIKKNFKARLYGEERELLSESFLILNKSKNHNIYHVAAYLPYYDKGHQFLIVRLKGKKEVILYKGGMLTQSKLQKDSEIYNEVGRSYWLFNEEDECHISPSIK